MKNYLIITLIFVLLSFIGISGTGHWVKDYKLGGLTVGSSYYIYEPTHIEQDNKVHTKYQGFIYLDYTRKSHSDLDNNQLPWRVEVSYSYYDLLGTLQTGALSINYKDDGYKYTDYAELPILQDVDGYDFKVTNITATYFQSGNWITQTDLNSDTPIPVQDIDFRLELRSTSVYHLDVEGSNSELPSFAAIPTSFPRISWSYISGAEEYDLEWVFIDTYSSEMIAINNASSSSEFYKIPFQLKESSRVRTWRTHHILDNTFPEGFIYFRVRAVSQFVENNALIDQIRLGEWNYFIVPSDYLNGNISASNISKYEVTEQLAFELQKNWLYGIAYAEDGKSVSSITYYDGSNRGRQSLTYNTSDDATLVGESKYDYEGRQTISVIPAPVKGRNFGYKVNFNMSGPGDIFDEDNYDFGNLNTVTQPLSIASGAARYFSPDNNFVDDLFRDAIPDAGGYVYSQTIYRNDGSGRIERVGGIGSDFQVNTDHSVRTYYGSPSVFELKRLFGNNVPDTPKGYRKEIVRDANGQHSVTYYDRRGNVIATGLSGASPDNLIALESEGEVTVVTSINNNNVQTDPYTLVSEHTFINTVPNNPITLNYSLLGHINSFPPQIVNVEGIEIEFPAYCSTCRYDLKIRVIKPNGGDLYNVDYPDIAFDLVGCEVPLAQENLAAINLVFADIGEYRIIKTLTVNVNSMQNAFDQMLGSIDLYSEEEFVNDYLQNVDLSACFETCEDYCMGQWVLEYKDENPTVSTVNAIAEWNALETSVQDAYVLACVNEPNSGCNQEELLDELIDDQFLTDEEPEDEAFANVCEQKHQLMLDQLMPGEVEYNRLIDEELSVEVSINGDLYSLEEIRDDASLSANFTKTHATVLLIYHREYCHLAYCNTWALSQAYSVKLTAKMHNTPWSTTSSTYLQPYNTTLSLGGTSYTEDPFIDQLANQWAGTNSTQGNLETRINDFLDLYGSFFNTFMTSHFGSLGLATPIPCIMPTTGNLATYIDGFINCAIIGNAYSADDINQMKVNAFKGMYDQLKEEILREYKLDPAIYDDPVCEYFHDDAAIFIGAMTQDEMEDMISAQLQNFEATQPSCEEMAYERTRQWVEALTIDCAVDLNAIYCVFATPSDYICNETFGATSLQQAYALNSNPGASANIHDLFYAFVMNTCPNNTYGLFYDPDPDNDVDLLPGEKQYDAIRDILLATCGLDGNGEGDTDGLLSFEVEAITTTTIQGLDVTADLPSEACLTNIVSFINLGFQNANLTPANGGSSNQLYTYNQTGVGNLLTGCNFFPSPASSYFGSSGSPILNWDPNGSRPAFYHFQLLYDPFNHGGCPLIKFNFSGLVDETITISSISNPVFYGVSADNLFFEYTVLVTYSNDVTATKIISIRPSCQAVVSQGSYTYSNVDHTILPLPYNYQEDCFESELNQAEVDAKLAYREYINTLYNQFLAGIDCIHKEKEHFQMTYKLNEYQYTLYYYDLVGNLVQTVPPQGVDILTQAEVNANQNPIHRMETRYEYNGLNTLMAQYTPDGGHSDFSLDKLYRVRYSQNARQEEEAKASYSQYDELGRVVEAGELLMPNSSTAILDLENAVEDAFPAGAVKLDYTHTYYEEGYAADPSLAAQFIVGQQENLRNAIGAVYHRQAEYNGVGALIPGSEITSLISYSYDAHKNVKELVSTNNHLRFINQQHKKVIYNYDLISGNVEEVVYQKGKEDEYRHKYHYDANNRLVRAFTSTDGIYWEMDAKYFYYLHGSLARTELGHDKVQGTDYAYNLQGWLKGVNSSTLNASRDLGKDAHTSGMNKFIGVDAHGFNLGYYAGDYQPIGTVTAFANTSAVMNNNINDDVVNPTGNNMSSLYNGNISHMVTAMRDLEEDVIDVLANNYRYDQLQRIKAMDVYQDANLQSNNNFSSATLYRGGAYQTRYSFDKNGNLMSLKRNGSGLQDDGVSVNDLEMDDFSYHYYDNLLNNGTVTLPNETNRLASVEDFADDEFYESDIKAGQVINNYQYDASGQLVKDLQEGIEEITWTVTGKVKEIKFTTASGKKNHKFVYDPMDMRIAKIVYNNADHTNLSYTYYTYDAQGNPMATYSCTQNYVSSAGNNHLYSEEFMLDEQMIYGASRLGVRKAEKVIVGAQITQTGLEPLNIDYEINTTRVFMAIFAQDYSNRRVGLKYYELSNHLGNVLVVVTDRKLGSDDESYYTPDVVSYSDYYPYGSLLDNRHGQAAEGDYRYGFNGMEADDEIKNIKGSSYTTEFRQYDPRVGRWMSLDPLMDQFPWMSPYVAFDNNPIYFVDPFGLSAVGPPDKNTIDGKSVDWTEGATFSEYGLDYTYSGGQWTVDQLGGMSYTAAKSMLESYESAPTGDGSVIFSFTIPVNNKDYFSVKKFLSSGASVGTKISASSDGVVKLYVGGSAGGSWKGFKMMEGSYDFGIMLENGELSVFGQTSSYFLGWDLTRTSINAGESQLDLDINLTWSFGGYSIGMTVDLENLNNYNMQSGDDRYPYASGMKTSNRAVVGATLQQPNASNVEFKVKQFITVSYQKIYLDTDCKDGGNAFWVSNFNSLYNPNKPADWTKTWNITNLYYNDRGAMKLSSSKYGNWVSRRASLHPVTK